MYPTMFQLEHNKVLFILENLAHSNFSIKPLNQNNSQTSPNYLPKFFTYQTKKLKMNQIISVQLIDSSLRPVALETVFEPNHFYIPENKHFRVRFEFIDVVDVR